MTLVGVSAMSVASWRAEATPSYDFSTYPGDKGCNSNTIRYLCIMRPRSIQLCSTFQPKSMKDGDSCWTECGEMECLRKYLVNADYDFAKESSSFDFKLADCSSYSTGRRYCRAIKLIP
ncbi:uncharacterized protein LOC128882685 isoform X2 [Hylaeus volcanicus]|uniref:uncharacterized protein LOC128882685 isoform X2 n=1 Tax=Hylaeus volcanicus TaxID=313075 RepID=UPI0023B83AD6|nr:uncharacterized protein LOC128882685 isoform X2 [Hylaeus volcanicus]